MKCEECDSGNAIYFCAECDQGLCPTCDEALHKGGKRKSHIRPKICNSCRSIAVMRCETCDISACENCEVSHMNHSKETFESPKQLGVFWDFGSCKPSRAEDIRQALNEISQRVGVPKFVRTYGDPWGRWKEAAIKEGITPIYFQGIKDNEAILLDVSVLSNNGLTHVLVITAHSLQIKPHLIQLKSNVPGIEFIISSRILPLAIETIAINESVPIKPRNREDNTRFSEVKEINQIDEKKTLAINQIWAYFKEEASKGNLLHEVPELIENLRSRLRTNSDSIIKLIKTAEKKNVIRLTSRELGDSSIEFASLKIEQLSLDLLLWTLRSLKADEMLPTEKAIQCRMREAFDIKPTTAQWDHLIQQARGHSHSSSAPVAFSLFSQPISNVPKFSIREIDEPSIGTKTFLIYPSGEEWEALDQHSKFGDYLNLKETEDWRELMQFLEDYFTSKKHKKSLQEEEIRVIPGGRYGCAQFVKLCGPNSMRSCSLGKISYMIQIAINEDLLRYQRTLLVWTPSHQRSTSKIEIQRKMQAIEKAILEYLEKPPHEISLAQLPLLLKRSLKFQLNITELGFAKLKDLLLAIPSVSVELRGTNHPFVVLNDIKLRQISNSPPSVDQILDLIFQSLNENKFGLSESKLEQILLDRLGQPISWLTYQVANLCEFIQTFGKNQFEIIKTKETYMIFRSENPHFEYFYSPFRDSFGSAVLEQTQNSSPSPHPRHVSSGYDDGVGIPNDIFFHNHMQRIVNISSLPMQLEKPVVEDKSWSIYENYFDSSNDLSSSLQGPASPHLSSGSVKFNPSANIWNVHNRTLSEGLSQDSDAKHSRLHYSGYEGWDLRPPPGFE